jgi:serine/threonine protein kinase
MDDVVTERICPHCAASTSASGPLEAACPQCGQPLATDEAELIADLRAAFGFGGVRDPDSVSASALLTDGSSARAVDRVSVERPGISASTPLSGGTRLGDFEVVGELGRGGMGVVYRARQLSLGREVALKVLPGYARYGPSAVQRFRTEAQAAARLHHTNIVAVYAQGEHQGHFYYAMELVEGLGLDEVIHSRPDLLSSTRLRGSSSARVSFGVREPTAVPSPPPAALPPAPRWTRADYLHLAAVVAEVADALECAHQSGVIHRDVKPHNLLLGANERLQLTDFGLARLTDEPHLTVTGEIMGTPAYLSPEQVSGDMRRIDHRTDIYSLGATLYELITRHRPFEGLTRAQVLASITAVDPAPPRRIEPQIPRDLETICLRAMEKDPARRHPTAAALAEDLRRFATGRPILSRRATGLEKTVKWMRRHKAATTALVAGGLVVLLTGGLTWSVSSTRQREAERLLAEAYEQLVYYDYKTPGLEDAKIRPAAQRGAPEDDVQFARALADMGQSAWADALEHVNSVLAHQPADLRALYLRAWAQRERTEYDAARATLAVAERYGDPNAADVWFLRGLALHYDQPDVAIECYRKASLLRAGEHSFYPQAVLHLARARNQQLYAQRELEPFPEAVSSLKQLVDYGSYGAYPCYLLSITHRLAAEIYHGSLGTRDDAPVGENYRLALDWARQGQALEPQNDRPIAAEAECLESLGQYQAAIEARSRALAVADADVRRWEHYHYRWRLYYWTGQYEAAQRDLEQLLRFAPQERSYRYVYPALVRAELGDVSGALEQARAIAIETPTSALAVIWSATALRLLGQADEARQLLAAQAPAVDFTAELVAPQTASWVEALYNACRGDGTTTELYALATGAATPWKLWGEAHFHLGALRLAAGDRSGAAEHFLRAYRSFDGEQRYTYHAKILWVQMQENVAWPRWAGVSLEQQSPGPIDRELNRADLATADGGE